MNRRIPFIIFFAALIQVVAFGQSKDQLDIRLASKVLSNAPDIVVGSEVGPNAETIAFNLIYRSDSSSNLYKHLYLKSTIAGKLYCVLGLYLLKDKEYENYKSTFLSEKSDSGIWFQAGSKRSNWNESPKALLDFLTTGLTNNIWFAPSFLLK